MNLSQNGRGEQELALLSPEEKSKAFGYIERNEGAKIDARGLLASKVTS
jgi:hypothetical protein